MFSFKPRNVSFMYFLSFGARNTPHSRLPSCRVWLRKPRVQQDDRAACASCNFPGQQTNGRRTCNGIFSLQCGLLLNAERRLSDQELFCQLTRLTHVSVEVSFLFEGFLTNRTGKCGNIAVYEHVLGELALASERLLANITTDMLG
jgi:hypothetical protein